MQRRSILGLSLIAAAAVTIAESLVRLGLSTSKVRTYAPARPKRFKDWPRTAAAAN